ncbi:hypothetical protein M8J75_001940 [Diaphorina citri]|nr:hypothetical protein M8J75_001940 [Diaphorina citri]
MDELRPNLGLLGLVEEHHHLSHHHHLHHEKRIAKTENPDFSALYALPGSNLDQQHSSPVRNLSDHSGKSFKLTATILKQHKCQVCHPPFNILATPPLRLHVLRQHGGDIEQHSHRNN